jgi:hypothetical protein
MSYVQKFKESLKTYASQDAQHQSHVSPRVIELAQQIKAWHDTRPVPDRWYPVQLGRLAAQLGASRELAAAALQYAGWVERRIGAGSFWQPK